MLKAARAYIEELVTSLYKRCSLGLYSLYRLETLLNADLVIKGRS